MHAWGLGHTLAMRMHAPNTTPHAPTYPYHGMCVCVCGHMQCRATPQGRKAWLTQTLSLAAGCAFSVAVSADDACLPAMGHTQRTSRGGARCANSARLKCRDVPHLPNSQPRLLRTADCMHECARARAKQKMHALYARPMLPGPTSHPSAHAICANRSMKIAGWLG